MTDDGKFIEAPRRGRGRPGYEHLWKETAYAMADMGLGPTAIRTELERVGRRSGRSAPRSEKTIRNWLEERAATGGEHPMYVLARWPETMLGEVLPWEASPALLDLIRLCAMIPYPGPLRPTVKLAEWFWRVSLAIPEAKAAERLDAAQFLAVYEALGRDFGQIETDLSEHGGRPGSDVNLYSVPRVLRELPRGDLNEVAQLTAVAILFGAEQITSDALELWQALIQEEDS